MFQLKPVAGLLTLHSVKCTLISYQSLTVWVIREWNKTILKRLPIQASERRVMVWARLQTSIFYWSNGASNPVWKLQLVGYYRYQ